MVQTAALREKTAPGELLVPAGCGSQRPSPLRARSCMATPTVGLSLNAMRSGHSTLWWLLCRPAAAARASERVDILVWHFRSFPPTAPPRGLLPLP